LRAGRAVTGGFPIRLMRGVTGNVSARLTVVRFPGFSCE